MAIGLSINLKLPRGEVESISAHADDPGMRIITLMLPIKDMYSLAEELDILRPDGQPLSLEESLQSQGLRNGSTLLVQEKSVVEVRRTWEQEKIVIDQEDFQQPDEGSRSYEDDPLLHPREERDEKARYLKERANDVLKEERFVEAIEMYTIALSWLPPEDSDQELAAALFGNRALAHLKLKDWRSARDDAEQSLLLQPENVKVRYRLAVAERELGNLETARAELRGVLKRDRGDKTARAALTAVEAELQARQAKEAEQPEPEVPAAIRWRLERLQQGYALPRFATVWQRVDSVACDGTVEETSAAALRHVLRSQPPLERFYRESLAAVLEGEVAGVAPVLLGAGTCAAAAACSALISEGRLQSATAVEPSRLLGDHCREAHGGLRVLQSQGQIDNEFAIPASAFEAAAASTAPTVVLLCDRIADNLVGERLLATVAAGLDAARRQLPPKAKVACVPSRAVLLCAPVELRCDEVAGWDVSKVNALRFSAHDTPEEREAQGARSWKCPSCSWFNHPKTKYECEMCKKEKSPHGLVQAGPPPRESYGWWPADLDEEAGQKGICCRALAEEQALWSYDFLDADAFSQQRRQLSRSLEVQTTCSGRMNAMAVWWRLEGPGGVELESRPAWRPRQEGDWPGKRQAVYYFGFEVGVEQDEKLTFNAELKDGLSRLKFDLLSPKLTERMGLVKFEVKLCNMQAVQELRRKLDLRTNRLLGPVTGTQLARRDKLIKFGPFDTSPGLLEDLKVWDRVEDRLRLHVNRPLKGDAPITCVFRHGAFEGTVRWPAPHMADGANVPRLPQYFEGMRECRILPYTEALARSLQDLPSPGARVLEIGCGPVPLLAMCAARAGARAWAVEMVPELQELAQEAVRENGLEMVFKYMGYSNYSFFGEAKRPEDPSVRVMKAMPSTSLRPGVTPKLLDGAKAHVVACLPGEGPLGEDYLETMWHAGEQLLEPGGVLLPRALGMRLAPVQWLPLGTRSNGLLHNRLCSGRTVQASASDELVPLCSASVLAMQIDLSSRPSDLPSTDGSLRIDHAGLLTGVAFWHEAEFGSGGIAEGGVQVVRPSAMVCFLRSPRKVEAGESVRFSLRFVDRQLQMSLPE